MPPEFPEKPTKTSSTKGSFELGSGVKRVHSLNTSVLLKNGWVRVGKVYLKGNDSLEYTGVDWVLNGVKKIQFLEDLNDKK